jgi:hypothetical protein
MSSGFALVWQQSAGPTVRAGDVTATPLARNIGVRWPGGGVLWSFPVAVEVTTGDQVETQSIVDVTRMAIIALSFGTALTILLVRSLRGEES